MQAYPNEEGLTADMVDTTTIRIPLLDIMSHKADQGGAPVYAYMFTYGNSYHGAEIPYVFETVEDPTAEQEAMEEMMSQAWISFARDGVPSADSLPQWEPYTGEGGATMILDTEPYMAYHHDDDLLSILVPDFVPAYENEALQNTADAMGVVSSPEAHQTEGGEVQVLHPGDVAFCPPGVRHWHGGSANTEFAHIAVNTNPELTGLEWYDRISDKEYAALSTE